MVDWGDELSDLNDGIKLGKGIIRLISIPTHSGLCALRSVEPGWFMRLSQVKAKSLKGFV